MTENAATESVYNGREPEGATTAGSHRLEAALKQPSRRDNFEGERPQQGAGACV